MPREATLARFEVSGEILSDAVLELLTRPTCNLPGAAMDPQDFEDAWELLSEHWQSIRAEVASFDTEHLRRRWQLLFLSTLGHDLEYQKSHTTFAGNRTIPITHRSKNLPVWLLGYGHPYDEKPDTGRRRRSPHELLQEYLDSTDDSWAILFNGKTIRLLHDYHKTLTRNYVEADLASIFDSLDVDAFRGVWRLFRAQAFQPDARGTVPIEQLRDSSRESGIEIGKELRKQVARALVILGNGFLGADTSGRLLEELRESHAAVARYYQALLRIVYRLLFLFYIESKPGWTPAQNPIWRDSYSITRLRELAEQNVGLRSEACDYWEGLKVVFRVVREGNAEFGIRPYGGELFDDEALGPLADASIRNAELLSALYHLTVFERDNQPYRVDFRTLRIDALGSVYEGLLAVAPMLDQQGRFAFAEGTERKLTGSYYTPPELVAQLIDSALVPVIEDKLKEANSPEEQETALLAISVVDPACGSGAFLVQALDKLAEKLCEIRLEGEEPSDLDIREARRDVVTHCIHGVDLNPMAVELCKFTLWLHVAHPELPLSYLEPRIKCGNSLVGVPLKSQVEAAKQQAEAERARILQQYRGSLNTPKAQKEYREAAYVGWPDSVPDEAFEPVTGDDKTVASRVKRRNREERESIGQGTLNDEWLRLGRLADRFEDIYRLPEDTIEQVVAKTKAYEEFVKSSAYGPAKLAADAWCAAFFWPLTKEHEIAPTTERYRAIERNPHAAGPAMLSMIRSLAERNRFFHWDLEFPSVSKRGGFDVVLGNPPWEHMELKEKEFFAHRVPDLTVTATGAERKRLIRQLQAEHGELYRDFIIARRSEDATRFFAARSRRFPLCARGRVNTYALFAELNRSLLAPEGRAGCIVPTGIATDDTLKHFFADLVNQGALLSLFDFENGMRVEEDQEERSADDEEVEPSGRSGRRPERSEGPKLFPDVDSRQKFCLLAMAGRGRREPAPRFAFFCHRVADLRREGKVFALSRSDIALLNPNTRTCPVFRSQRDAELAKAIYRRVPILIREGHENGNPWSITFSQGLFNMTSDSHLFRTRKELEAEGYVLKGNVFEPSEPTAERYLPLYEAKMIHQFDHRWATYEVLTEARGKKRAGEPVTRDATSREKADPRFVVSPRYWVAEGEVEARAKSDAGWFLGWRDICRPTDVRTAIFGVLPRVGAGDTLALALAPASACDVACLQACLDSMALDYVCRSKLGGTHLNYFYLKQLPVFPPGSFRKPCEWEPGIAYADWIVPRVLELTYTAYDLAPWARDLGYAGEPFRWDDERRFRLRAELDAAFFHLYLPCTPSGEWQKAEGETDEELESLKSYFPTPRDAAAYVMDTFPIVRRKDLAQYGTYRTKETILSIYDSLTHAL